jgi:SAM-dependent methyltransferase
VADRAHARLVESLWDADRDYYDRARVHVHEAARAGGEYDWLRERLPSRGTVLEVGCGEGSNLEVLSRPGLRFVGCDVAALPLRLALEHVPTDRSRAYLQADAERLPFRPSAFDAVFAVSLLEHLAHPERALGAMVDAVRPGGSLLLVSPQYGGPLGASPARHGGGLGRFVRRLVRSLRPAAPGLDWDRVDPPVLAGAAYEGDLDALVEPELRSLRAWLVARGLRIVDARSGLEWHSFAERRSGAGARALRRLCEALGRAGIPPFRDFGPLLVVHARRPGPS